MVSVGAPAYESGAERLRAPPPIIWGASLRRRLVGLYWNTITRGAPPAAITTSAPRRVRRDIPATPLTTAPPRAARRAPRPPGTGGLGSAERPPRRAPGGRAGSLLRRPPAARARRRAGRAPR